jgi:TonB family protein
MEGAMRQVILVVCGVMALTVGAGTQTRDNPVRVGQDVPAPRKIKDVPPVYPEEARRRGVRGVVILELTLNPGGDVTEVAVIRPLSLVTEAAVAAARQWRYERPTYRGEPAWVILAVTLRFPPAARPPRPEPPDETAQVRGPDPGRPTRRPSPVEPRL